MTPERERCQLIILRTSNISLIRVAPVTIGVTDKMELQSVYRSARSKE